MSHTSLNICTLFSEIWRRLKLVVGNHYFLLVFFIIVIIIGSISIWFTSVFSSEGGRWERLLDNMNTLNFLAFSAPLLATTVFEKTMGLILKRGAIDENGVAILLWLALGTFITFGIIITLYGIGSGNGGGFSWCSLFAWIISLIYWAVANIENPNYSMNADTKSASGGAEVRPSSELRRG